MKKKFFITLFFFANLAIAQDTIYLNEITIQEKSSYNNLIQIDSVKLRNAHLMNVGELLQNEAGFYVKKYGQNSLQTISIRGTSSFHNILLWNGIPVFSPLNGQVNLSNILYNTNQTVFIGYNTFSQSYISGAFGGIIYLKTNISENQKPFIIGRFQYESLNNKSLFLSNLFNIKKIKFLNSLTYETNQNKFTFYNNAVLPTLKSLNKSKTNQLTFNNEIFYKLKKSYITVSNQFQKSFNEVPPLMTYAYQVRHEEWNTQQSVQSALNFVYANSFLTTFGFRYAQTEYQLNHSYNNIPVKIISSITREPTLYFSTNYKKQISSSVNATTSFKYYIIKGLYKNKVHNICFNEALHRFEFSNSVNKEWKYFSQKAQITFLKESKKINVLPSIIHKFLLSKKSEIIHTLGYNVRYPYLNELFFIPGGNLYLRPEKAIQSDVILKYKPIDNLETKISPHFSAYNDWILWYPTAFGYWEAKNIRKINIYGIDYSLTNNFLYKKQSFYQTLIYSLTLANGNDYVYHIHHIPYVPKHKISYYTQYSFKLLKFINDISLHSKRFPLTYDNYIVLKPYLIWNSAIMFDFKNITFNITVDNILNTSYQNILWRPMPGRYYRFSITFKIQNNEN